MQGSNLQYELDSLHGQATVLAALMSISPRLPLGYPARYSFLFALVCLIPKLTNPTLSDNAYVRTILALACSWAKNGVA